MSISQYSSVLLFDLSRCKIFSSRPFKKTDKPCFCLISPIFLEYVFLFSSNLII